MIWSEHKEPRQRDHRARRNYRNANASGQYVLRLWNFHSSLIEFNSGVCWIAAGEPTECFNPNAAVMRAEALARKERHVGAVAFSRTGDPATGDFSDAKVIRKFGDVPNDLRALF